MAKSDHGEALPCVHPSQPFAKFLHTARRHLLPKPAEGLASRGQASRLRAGRGLSNEASKTSGLEVDRESRPGLAGCLCWIRPSSREAGFPGPRSGTTTPETTAAGLPEARAGRGGSCWDPAKRTGVNLERKTGGGKSYRANLSVRHHERGFCCKAIQRTWHESTSHG